MDNPLWICDKNNVVYKHMVCPCNGDDVSHVPPGFGGLISFLLIDSPFIWLQSTFGCFNLSFVRSQGCIPFFSCSNPHSWCQNLDLCWLNPYVWWKASWTLPKPCGRSIPACFSSAYVAATSGMGGCSWKMTVDVGEYDRSGSSSSFHLWIKI